VKTMNNKVIEMLYERGLTASEISRCIGVASSTVRSHINRHCLTRETSPCDMCGVQVVQVSGRKKKRFCSDRCRMAYWNQQRGGKKA